MPNTNRPSYYKTNEEIALLLTLLPGRTEAGRKVSHAVRTRVEIAMVEAELFGAADK